MPQSHEPESLYDEAMPLHRSCGLWSCVEASEGFTLACAACCEL